MAERSDVTRAQLERAAELAEREGDEYAERWSVIHERMAEAVIASRLEADRA